MLINGCLTQNNTGVNEDDLTLIFEEIGHSDDIDNEALARIGGDFDIFFVEGDSDDFIIRSKDIEHRIISKGEIDNIFRSEADDVYDEDQWRAEVNTGGTMEGYDDWFESILDEADYGSFFASYDGNEETCEDYYIFRVG